MPDDQTPDQGADQTPDQPAAKEKRKPGKKWVKGQSGNPSGVAKVLPDDAAGGIVNASRMRAVLATDKAKDVSPTDRALRAWLGKNPRDFLAALNAREKEERGESDLKAENDRLRAEVEELRKRGADAPADEGDPGTEAPLALIEKILVELPPEAGPDGRCPACGSRVQR